jgi:hypothetical protein
LILDHDIVERRIEAFRNLPWPISALTVISMSDEDLDDLDASSKATGAGHYWTVLNRVVTRIKEGASRISPALVSSLNRVKASR